MCVLVVPDELKQLQIQQQEERLQFLQTQKQYNHAFENYWQILNKDKLTIVEREKTTDEAFLEMVHFQHMP